MGSENAIYVGWYKNNKRHGNWMHLRGNDMCVMEEGYYRDNKREGDM